MMIWRSSRCALINSGDREDQVPYFRSERMLASEESQRESYE
jgi:hypothetical protein